MADDGRLDGLLRADSLNEILRRLTPEEALMALMRLNGKTDEEIAELLGVDRTTVTKWMLQARDRIARELPEAAPWLEGRSRPRRKGRRGRGIGD